MKKRTLFDKLVLFPLSKLYGVVTAVRNWLFDINVLHATEFPVPVVVVGNLAVGGTGKTPHTEYVVEALRHTYHVGVLSRGYKRSSKGFVMAGPKSTPRDIGDEPFQIYRKYGRSVTVAVCEDRCRGISEMLRIDPAINLIVLDDAFQHRYVKPTVSVVLTEYSRPVFSDSMLPYGRLRESASGLSRADIVVVSKCPPSLSPLQYKIFEKHLDMFPYQSLFFSKLVYGELQPLFPTDEQMPVSMPWLTRDDVVLAVCGIANPRPFVKYLKSFGARVKVNVFPDHHNYQRRDVELIVRRFNDMRGSVRLIVTTEKDAVRLISNPYIPRELKPYMYYVPVKVEMDRNEGELFIDTIRKAIADKKR